MCGRFAQAQTREDYLAYLADEGDRDIAYDPEPIGRYTWRQAQKFCCLANAMSSYISIRCSGATRPGGGIKRL